MKKDKIIKLQKQLINEQEKIIKDYKKNTSFEIDESQLEKIKEKIEKYFKNDEEINHLNVHSYIKLIISYKLKIHYSNPFEYFQPNNIIEELHLYPEIDEENLVTYFREAIIQLEKDGFIRYQKTNTIDKYLNKCIVRRPQLTPRGLEKLEESNIETIINKYNVKGLALSAGVTVPLSETIKCLFS